MIPFFQMMKDSGVLPITHPDMTRFNITLDQGVDMVLWAMQNMLGGEIFVPKIPSYRILDVAEAVCPQCEKPVVGIRPGEKLPRGDDHPLRRPVNNRYRRLLCDYTINRHRIHGKISSTP